MTASNTPISRFVPDMLDIGGVEIAVRAETRNKARTYLAGECGVEYMDMKVRRAWMRECDCEGCEEDGPDKTHGYDSYWVFCERTDPGALDWWVG